MISNEHSATFARDGYLHLRGGLSTSELSSYLAWTQEIEGTDIATINADSSENIRHQLNRPISRVIDADPRFGCFLDHPAVEPYLTTFLGQDYRHIDNDLYYTYPGYAGGGWHRGVLPHPRGHFCEGGFVCPMVKVFYCLSDVGSDQGAFVVIPGSHQHDEGLSLDRIDLPGQHIFDDVIAGDVIIFNEALLHNGRPNPSTKTRKTILVNFGRADAGVWPGYQPLEATLKKVTSHQRAILTNAVPLWTQPELSSEPFSGKSNYNA